MPLDASPRPIHIAPSVLPADFSRLGEELKNLEDAGVDRIQWDVMDGRFVPNLTFGPDLVAACKRSSDLPLDVHLMMRHPSRWLGDFVQAGADVLTVHAEVEPHLHRTLARIRELGAKAGLAVNPLTPLEVVREALPYLDLVLVMSVNPGFGGQAWIPASEARLRTVQAWRDEAGLPTLIEVDGGIGLDTARVAARAGADVLVAGSAVFGSGDVAANLAALRRAADGDDDG